MAKDSFGTAAYGGENWSPRLRTHREEIGDLWVDSGVDSEFGRLRTVVVHCPGEELAASIDPEAVQMLEPLDLPRAVHQHQGMVDAYRANDVDVHYVEPNVTPTPNQMFCADLVFMTPEGAIMARPASTVRAGEERWVARRLADMGVPILRTLTGNATFEGADAAWLDPRTLIVGRGLRTNTEGAIQVAEAAADIGTETIIVDLPYGTMHFMGMLRIVDHDLAIVWPRRTPHAAVEALRERDIEVAFLPLLDEFENQSAFNFVTLGPRKILMVADNPLAEEFYQNLDIEVVTVPCDELRKAAGAVGCLTGIISRDLIG
jgi:N-dimethylarginine dimethylaminohydrolase